MNSIKIPKIFSPTNAANIIPIAKKGPNGITPRISFFNIIFLPHLEVQFQYDFYTNILVDENQKHLQPSHQFLLS